MRFFITGATGFVGRNLVRRLAREGHEIVAFCRATSRRDALAGLPIRWVAGDITDRATLAREMRGCEGVFHLAATVTFERGVRAEMYTTNIDGTRAVAAAALDAGVRRLVHTSSVAACAHSRNGQILTESDPWNSRNLNIDYFTTKHLAEIEINKSVERGLDAVIVNPGTIFGVDAQDETLQFIRDLARRRLPARPGGGCAFVGVDDVVDAHIRAFERGRRGEKYIIGSENLRWAQLMELICNLLNTRPPRFTLPPGVLRAAAGMVGALNAAGIRTGALSRDGLRGLSVYLFFNYEKSARELGLRPAPMREVLGEIIVNLRKTEKI